jgi:hypothetical protein
MALTSKDLQIINQALAQYQATLDDGYDDELGRPNNFAYDHHKKEFGDPLRTVEATRIRVIKEINKRERTCV